MDVAEAPRALIAQLAQTLGVPELPLGPDDGWHVNLGEDNAYLYCRDGRQMLIVVPVAALPPEVTWAQTNTLLRENLFDSAAMPFQIAADNAGTVVQWGLLPVADLTGSSLVTVLQNLGQRADLLRNVLFPPAPAA